MFLRIKPLVLSAAMIAATSSIVAHADSDFVSGAANAALNASTHLDFQIVIPRFIRFQVGAANSIDLVQFDMSGAAASVGSGADVARSNGGAVPVILQSNGGTVSLVGATAGALTNADGDTISFDEIVATSTNLDLLNPTLVDGASSVPIAVAPNAGVKVVNHTADWTFAYSNSNIVAAGTYGGVNVNNGRVTYTASLP